MNFKKIAYRELGEILNTHNNYSLGEAIYSVLRLKNFNLKLKDIKDITDEEFYNLIGKALKEEEEIKFTEEELKLIN